MEDQTGSSPQQAQSGAPAPAPQQVSQEAVQLDNLHRAIRSGGSWFYWIAVLSLINTIIVLAHGSFHFIFGLGFTQLVDEFIREYKKLAVIGLPINIFVTALYGVLGYFACRRARWAFVTGIVFYVLDALLFVLVKDVLGIAFHAFALFGIYRGYKADGQAREIEARM